MGAPFEGLWSQDIPDPDLLISSYFEYHGYPAGQYTDDTQLTLATVEAIVRSGDVSIPEIARSIAELWRHHSVIGPGGACTQAAERYLATGLHQNMGAAVGQAGNGTAMRTAVLGLWYGEDREALVSSVAAISRLTHQDPRSIAGGVAIALAANLLAADRSISPRDLCAVIADATQEINVELSGLIRALPGRMNSSDVLEFIAQAGQATAEFNAPIITPFVVPTVLASIYCIVQHRDSWADAVTSAIRLGGDVDTLGAIVGALAGIVHGFEGIPANLVAEVQDSDVIKVLAAKYHALIMSQ